MIALDLEQGTAEWAAARCGIPTASDFDKIVTASGEPSKQRTKYLYQLAGERLLGKKEESYQNGAMLRGMELEAEARSLYELTYDVSIEQVGLCYKDESKLYACSPDGLIGKDGGIEIKCPNLTTHIGYLVTEELPAEYFQQVQGNLLVTGRKWWAFMSYYPGIKPLILKIERDKEFIKALEKQLELFCKDLDTLTEKLK